MSSLSLSSIKDITNLASVSIANIDLLTNKQGQPSSQALSQVHTYKQCLRWVNPEESRCRYYSFPLMYTLWKPLLWHSNELC